MKKKITAFVMAASLLCNCTMFSANNAVPGQIFVSAAVTDTVPEGYTPIYTIDDLYAIRNNLSGNYILMNDIDMSATAPGGDWDCGYGWKPIGGKGEDAFSGVFDGNGYAIKNMHIYGEPDETNIGLFARVRKSIQHLSLECDIDITLDCYEEHNVGTIAGLTYAPSTVNECFVTGNLSIITYSSGTSTSYSYWGGLIGDSDGIIENCFNASTITLTCKDKIDYSTLSLGGISGYGEQVKFCYSMGAIVVNSNGNEITPPNIGYISGDHDQYSALAYTSCFYPQNESGYSALVKSTDKRYTNVVGLTKGQMKSSAAYTGFDFDEVWTIDTNADYPYPTLRNVPYVSASEEQPSTEPTTNPSSDSSLKGDINGDGKVNATDAAIILVYAAMTGAGHQVSIDDLY